MTAVIERVKDRTSSENSSSIFSEEVRVLVLVVVVVKKDTLYISIRLSNYLQQSFWVCVYLATSRHTRLGTTVSTLFPSSMKSSSSSSGSVHPRRSEGGGLGFNVHRIFFLLLLCMLLILVVSHGLLAIGHSYYYYRDVVVVGGPLFTYNPSQFLFRGEPLLAASDGHDDGGGVAGGGVEAIFPIILGGFYSAITAGLVYAFVFALISSSWLTNASAAASAPAAVAPAIRTAVLLPLTFHGIVVAMHLFDDKVSQGFVNTTTDHHHHQIILWLHGALGLLCCGTVALLAASVFWGSQDLQTKTPTPKEQSSSPAPARFNRSSLPLLLLSLLIVLHAMIALGILFHIGPVQWEPAVFLVRDETPATDQPGLESAFPRYIGAIYAAFTMCFLYAVVVTTAIGRGTNAASAKTAAVPIMVYHFSALRYHLFQERADRVVNRDKMDPQRVLFDHALLGVLGVLTFVLSNNNHKVVGSATRHKKRQ